MGLIALKCPQCGGDIQLEGNREIGYCMYCGSQIATQPQKKIRNITFVRNSEFVPSFGKYHIYINGVEKIALAFGQSKTIQLEDGTYHLRGSILGNSINMPLNVSKDTVVCINLNNQERKWEFVTN